MANGFEDLKKFKDLLESLPEEVDIRIKGNTRSKDSNFYDEVNPTLLR